VSTVELHNGDCLEIMPTLSGPVDMILADLPYGTTACKWDTIIPLEPLWAEYKRLIKRNGAIVLTASQPFTSALVMSNPKWFKYSMVWDKECGTDYLLKDVKPLKAHEDILVFGDGRLTYNPAMTERFTPLDTRTWAMTAVGTGDLYSHKSDPTTLQKVYTHKFPTSVLSFHVFAAECNNTRRVHPTQKPVALMEYLIRTYTNEGETVLDNTMGSGTTGVACINTNRNFIGIEKDAGYYGIAWERIEAAQAVQRLDLQEAS
jgi:site-specific DNA-methyltransferase (adenine-specific)